MCSVVVLALFACMLLFCQHMQGFILVPEYGKNAGTFVYNRYW